MRDTRSGCSNMNHGRSNPPVKFCPNCGEKFKSTSVRQCTEADHAAQMKDRGTYCCDCGKKLSPKSR